MSYPKVHHVLFDCNVFIMLFNHFGPNLHWPDVVGLAAEPEVKGSLPSNIRDIITCMSFVKSGRRPDGSRVRVWGSGHVQDTVVYKMRHSGDNVWAERDRGASQLIMDSFYDFFGQELFAGVVGTSEHGAERNPPLDHEDGMVYGACRTIAGQNPVDVVWLITFDRSFIREAERFKPKMVNVCKPGEYISSHIRSGGSLWERMGSR